MCSNCERIGRECRYVPADAKTRQLEDRVKELEERLRQVQSNARAPNSNVGLEILAHPLPVGDKLVGAVDAHSLLEYPSHYPTYCQMGMAMEAGTSKNQRPYLSAMPTNVIRNGLQAWDHDGDIPVLLRQQLYVPFILGIFFTGLLRDPSEKTSRAPSLQSRISTLYEYPAIGREHNASSKSFRYEIEFQLSSVWTEK